MVAQTNIYSRGGTDDQGGQGTHPPVASMADATEQKKTSAKAAAGGTAFKRVDLHCHSRASNEADEAMLAMINCPESFSEPDQVYRQAVDRGMDFVTVTDHDTIDGVLELVHHGNVIVGEELTCYFPEDRCKIHLLVWGVSPSIHGGLQARADDIYDVAEFVEAQKLAHAVAHPVYRQNDVLERWHLERLMLMFKGFECLNGAHSALHREAFEPMLEALTPEKILEMERRHGMRARWPEPHIKARTGGSDDHGLFNIGRTWTNVPAGCNNIADVLQALRTGNCSPGGEAGSSIKLAHNFYSVGVKYAARTMAARSLAKRSGVGGWVDKFMGRTKARPDMHSILLQSLVGERPPVSRLQLGMLAARQKMRGAARQVAARLGGQKLPSGTSLLMELFTRHLPGHLKSSEPVWAAIKDGRAPLAEHEAMFELVGKLNRDVTAGIASAVEQAIASGKMMPLFDALSAVAAQQFLMMPYHFAQFHQNRERHHLARITGTVPQPTIQTMRVAIFTDALDRQSASSRWVSDLANEGAVQGRRLTVHTCGAPGGELFTWQRDFSPMYKVPLPQMSGLQFVLPPVTEILDHADREQFDVVHVETPGPMGFVGVLVAKMLNVPLVVSEHTDYGSVVATATGDHRLTSAAKVLIEFLRGRADLIARRPVDDTPDDAIWEKWLGAVLRQAAESRAGASAELSERAADRAVAV